MKHETKIILFGGTFDPIHNGHIAVAQHALKSLQAKNLIFVPASQSPHKKQPPADGLHRLEMIRCSVEHINNMTYSDCELRRCQPSYTIDTVRFFREQEGPDAQLYWLIGADQLRDLAKWYRVEELLAECHVSTMVRGGYPKPDMNCFKGVFASNLIQKLRDDIIMTPEIPISSTYIRNELLSSKIPAGMLPDCVMRYIIQHQMYGFKQS